MNSLLARISSYNIFNYLFPGVVFCFLVDEFTGYQMLQDDIVVGLFLYYFAGLVISRIGSLAVQGVLEWFGIVSFRDYSDYVDASKIDDTISGLSEQNNSLRTLLAVFVVFALVKLYELSGISACLSPATEGSILCITLILLFLLAYRKQTAIIQRRIEIALQSKTPATLPEKGEPQ